MKPIWGSGDSFDIICLRLLLDETVLDRRFSMLAKPRTGLAKFG